MTAPSAGTWVRFSVFKVERRKKELKWLWGENTIWVKQEYDWYPVWLSEPLPHWFSNPLILGRFLDPAKQSLTSASKHLQGTVPQGCTGLSLQGPTQPPRCPWPSPVPPAAASASSPCSVYSSPWSSLLHRFCPQSGQRLETQVWHGGEQGEDTGGGKVRTPRKQVCPFGHPPIQHLLRVPSVPGTEATEWTGPHV